MALLRLENMTQRVSLDIIIRYSYYKEKRKRVARRKLAI
jgi:hypothetical protein